MREISSESERRGADWQVGLEGSPLRHRVARRLCRAVAGAVTRPHSFDGGGQKRGQRGVPRYRAPRGVSGHQPLRGLERSTRRRRRRAGLVLAADTDMGHTSAQDAADGHEALKLLGADR